MNAAQNRFKQVKPCRPQRRETQRFLVLSMSARADMEPQPSAPSGGSAVRAATNVGAL